MTSLIDEPQILKSDRRGRVRVPKERREALLAEFARSGVSGAQFARLVGLKYATFIGWVAQERRQRAAVAAAEVTSVPERPASPARVRLFEAMVEGPRLELAGRPLLIDLPGGVRLQLAEAAHVPLAAQLLLTLRQQESRSC